MEIDACGVEKPTNKLNRMTYFDPAKNKVFFGSTDKLSDWTLEKLEQGKIIDKIKLMLKNYLELDNVSFLFGSGTSIHFLALKSQVKFCEMVNI